MMAVRHAAAFVSGGAFAAVAFSPGVRSSFLLTLGASTISTAAFLINRGME